jgi:OOP family OmpA-OmpF porin
MKHLVIAVLAAACAIPATAGNGYYGAAVGRAEQTLNIAGVDMAENSTSGKLFVGQQFNRVLGAELGLIQFGNAIVSGGGIDVTSRPSSLYAAVTGAVPLSEQWAVYGKLGVARTHSRISASSYGWADSANANHTGPMFGAGIGYSLNAKVLLFGEFEKFGKVLNEGAFCLKLQHVTFGARFKF